MLQGKLSKKTNVLNTRIPINDYLFIFYKLLTGHTYAQIERDVNVSLKTITVIRKRLRHIMSIYMGNKNMLIGGIGKVIECDESVLSRRGIIMNPTSAHDKVKDTIWILGCIDNNLERNFFVKRIPDRKAETLTKVLESVIGVCSNFCTDGYPSYPEVARNLHVVHHVVNHSLGFKSEDGTHKNNIEGFCAILKYKMRK